MSVDVFDETPDKSPLRYDAALLTLQSLALRSPSPLTLPDCFRCCLPHPIPLIGAADLTSEGEMIRDGSCGIVKAL